MKLNKLYLLIVALFVSFSISSLASNPRQVIDFGADWKFMKTTSSAPQSPTVDDSKWPSVNIPHTWNATDAQDGGNNYSRTVGWYRKHLQWDSSFEGKRVYLEVLAASLLSDTYVDGNLVGNHRGGYNAFRYDITDYLKKDEPTLIAIKVDNRHTDDIAPLSGDFSFIGGIYREIFLVVADEVHVDLEDDATNGLYLTTTEVSKSSAKLEIRAKVVNKSSISKTLDLTAVLKNPDSFEGIAEVPNPLFNPADMAPGGTVETIEEKNISIAAGESYEFKRTISVANPHLWDGLEDPYRYQVDFTVKEGGQTIDEVSDYVGFRFFHADNTGFYLNGRLYPLRGVNRHQDWEDMGYAISKNEHNIDFGMIYEIGANTVRLAHYPQDPYFHELFDKYGIVIWVEIPFVDKFGNNLTKFMETTRLQLREMIKQRYNRPSILMWGLQNEVSTGNYDAQMSSIMPELHNYTKELDPTGRLTVQAQAGADRSNWTTDLFAKNQYPGWYQSGTFGSYMDGYKNKHYVNGKYHPVGMSEYGGGGNPHQHEIITLSGTAPPGSPYGHQQPWHPEEYQSLIHELAIKDINARPWIWGTYVWNMFDFASDSRNEGGTPGINDKGIVTHDRQIKKDAFYVYKVNWSKEPTVHIASRRFAEREHSFTPVKVYTNQASVELFVNGVSKGVKQRTTANAGILEWKDVELDATGINVVEAKAANGVEDRVEWLRKLSSSTDINSTQLLVDNNQKVISLTVNVTAEQINAVIKSANNATFKLVENDGSTPVTTGNIQAGMKLIVTAEDGETVAVYEFIVQHIAYKKAVSASAVENQTNTANKAVDGDLDTRWAAPNNASAANPHWLEVDLGKNYVLNNIGIHWFDSPTNSRAYRYTILSKKEGESTYKTVVNRSNNTQNLFVGDVINNEIGRYVKINITGSAQNSAYNYPSIYEVQINGWMISSSVYEIDFDKKEIIIPFTGENIDVQDFIDNITFEGNETHRVESAAYYVVEGAELVITDTGGKETAFTLRFDTSSVINNLPISSKYFKASHTGSNLNIIPQDNHNGFVRVVEMSGRQLVATNLNKQISLTIPNGTYVIYYKDDNGTVEAIKYVMN